MPVAGEVGRARVGGGGVDFLFFLLADLELDFFVFASSIVTGGGTGFIASMTTFDEEEVEDVGIEEEEVGMEA